MLKNNVAFLLFNITNDNVYNILFDTISKLSKNNPYNDVLVFSNSCDKIDTKNIPILHINHAKFFSGDLLIFDILGLIMSNNFPNLNQKIFYANDMPWIKNRNNTYSEWKKIYSKNVEFIVPNSYLYDIYSLCWKKPLDIMESFDHEKIQHILQSTI